VKRTVQRLVASSVVLALVIAENSAEAQIGPGDGPPSSYISPLDSPTPARPVAPPDSPPVEPPPQPVWEPRPAPSFTPTVDPRNLEGYAFYVAVGRPELARRYRRRRHLKRAIQGGGAILLGVGLGAAAYLWAFESLDCVEPGDECNDNIPNRLTYASLGAAGVGLVLLVAPAFVRTDPVSADEKEELARQARYAHRAFVPSPTDLRLRLAPPSPGQSAASLVLSGRF
jgi:hypothetical protein